MRRTPAKTHVTTVKPEDIDEWQSEMQALVTEHQVPRYLNGNKDETPTKLNVSAAKTVDVKGIIDVRFKDQGHLKEQYTTYAGGWAGAMTTPEVLLSVRPEIVGINDFTKDGHLMPSLSIFKGKTARTLKNILLEVIRFDPLYPTYLQERSVEAYVPSKGLHGVPLAWRKYVQFHPVPETIQVWRQSQLTNPSAVPTRYIPYIIHEKTGHIVTVTPSGWNTTETEHLHNVLCILPEVQRRRLAKGRSTVALISSDNYITHHTLDAVKKELGENNTLTPALRPNSTGSVQWCDTDLNACLKVKQKQLQGIQLYNDVLEDFDFDLTNVPDDPN